MKILGLDWITKFSCSMKSSIPDRLWCFLVYYSILSVCKTCLSHLYKYIAKSSKPWHGSSIHSFCQVFRQPSALKARTAEPRRPISGPISITFWFYILENYISLYRVLWVCYTAALSLNFSFSICKVGWQCPPYKCVMKRLHERMQIRASAPCLAHRM